MRLKVALLSLVLSAVLVAQPTIARAEQIARFAPSPWISGPETQLPRPPRLDLTTAQAVALAGRSPVAHLAPLPREIRLSRGAKTAIIVGAIVGGILIIAGVIVLAKPHKP